MTDKSGNWINRAMPLKVFLGLSVGLFIVWLLSSIATGIYDNDMYWLVATGREIIENGVPHVNLWTADNKAGFVAQQWLYAAGIAFADKLGPAGYSLFFGVQFVAFFLLSVVFFRIKNISGGKFVFSMALMLVLCQTYVFSVRPEIITLVLLLVECIALEKYHGTGKFAFLILLPVSMLLEINLHASMCVFHYVVLAAYLVPAFYCKTSVKNKLYAKWQVILPTVITMTAVMWINPYGTEAVIYTFKSFAAKSFKYLAVTEMMPADIISKYTLTLVPAFMLLFICVKFRRIESTSFNMILGFSALTAYATRNVMFMPIAFLFLLRDFWQAIDGKIIINWTKDVKNYLYFIFAVGYIFICGNFLALTDIADGGIRKMSGYDEISDCIVADAGTKNVKLFTGFDCGGFFEYEGFKSVYMDARPELYTSMFTGDKNILADYAAYCIGYSGFTEDEMHSRTSFDSIDDWFSYYDFDYIVANKGSETYLCGYLQSSEKYDVLCRNNAGCILYKKVVGG